MYRGGDVQQALLRMGILVEERNSELTGYCPMHLERTGKEDHNPSWSMNTETGVHHCFSCGYKGTLLTLVAEVRELKTDWGRLDFEAAKEWLRSNVEIDFELLSKQLEEMRDTYIYMPKPVEMSEARLAVFDSPPQWALDARGLSAEACALHSVKWDARQEAWITPIRNSDGFKLMGWQEKGQTNRTFRNRPTGVTKSMTLFGIDSWKSGTMIVVESPLDVVRLSSYGITGGVSTFGASISEAQVDLMRMADKLIIAFDNPRIDAAGEKASKDMFARTKDTGLECWFFNYSGTDAKDVGDMGEEDILSALSNSRHCVFGEKAIYGN